MTKRVRVENADTSDHKVRIITQCKNKAGEWVNAEQPDIEINYPTAMAELVIYSGRRLIIEEH